MEQSLWQRVKFFTLSKRKDAIFCGKILRIGLRPDGTEQWLIKGPRHGSLKNVPLTRRGRILGKGSQLLSMMMKWKKGKAAKINDLIKQDSVLESKDTPTLPTSLKWSQLLKKAHFYLQNRMLLIQIIHLQINLLLHRILCYCWSRKITHI